MQAWLAGLIQQFGKDIAQATPDALESGRRELEAHRNPYLDKWAYWTRRGGDAENDADDHQFYDAMTDEEKLRLAELQIAGSVGWYNATKPKHRRPWTGARTARMSQYWKAD